MLLGLRSGMAGQRGADPSASLYDSICPMFPLVPILLLGAKRGERETNLPGLELTTLKSKAHGQNVNALDRSAT